MHQNINHTESDGDILPFSEISPDQFAASHYDLDVKYRSLAIHTAPQATISSLQPISGKHHLHEANSSQPPKLTKQDSSSKNWSPISFSLDILPSKDSEDVMVRDAPYLLMNTHFVCDRYSIDSILDTVEQVLNENIESSFEFRPSECTWNAICRQGTSKCKFEISVYKGSEPSKHIIEAHKLSSGDGLLFKAIYQDIKTKLSSQPAVSFSFGDEVPSMIGTASSPLPSHDSNIPDDVLRSSIDLIVQMSNEPFLEAKEEASRMFYDISTQDSLLHHLCEIPIFEFFIEVLAEEDAMFENTKHNVVLTIANLSESLVGQAVIVDSGAFASILKLVSNGPYTTIEMRRESARIIANVASKLSARVSSSVSASELDLWMDGVPSLEDDRLRMHADRAKISLTTTA